MCRSIDRNWLRVSMRCALILLLTSATTMFGASSFAQGQERNNFLGDLRKMQEALRGKLKHSLERNSGAPGTHRGSEKPASGQEQQIANGQSPAYAPPAIQSATYNQQPEPESSELPLPINHAATGGITTRFTDTSSLEVTSQPAFINGREWHVKRTDHNAMAPSFGGARLGVAHMTATEHALRLKQENLELAASQKALLADNRSLRSRLDALRETLARAEVALAAAQKEIDEAQRTNRMLSQTVADYAAQRERHLLESDRIFQGIQDQLDDLLMREISASEVPPEGTSEEIF